MSPWRLGGAYDRPIPRRIAEQSGVARDAFGIAKRAVTEPMYYDDRDVADALGPAALADFERFSAPQRPLIELQMGRLLPHVVRATRQLRERITWRASAIPHLRWVAQWVEPRLDEHWRRRGNSLLLPHWAVQRVALQYRRALEPTRGTSGRD